MGDLLAGLFVGSLELYDFFFEDGVIDLRIVKTSILKEFNLVLSLLDSSINSFDSLFLSKSSILFINLFSNGLVSFFSAFSGAGSEFFLAEQSSESDEILFVLLFKVFEFLLFFKAGTLGALLSEFSDFILSACDAVTDGLDLGLGRFDRGLRFGENFLFGSLGLLVAVDFVSDVESLFVGLFETGDLTFDSFIILSGVFSDDLLEFVDLGDLFLVSFVDGVDSLASGDRFGDEWFGFFFGGFGVAGTEVGVEPLDILQFLEGFLVGGLQ